LTKNNLIMNSVFDANNDQMSQGEDLSHRGDIDPYTEDQYKFKNQNGASHRSKQSSRALSYVSENSQRESRRSLSTSHMSLRSANKLMSKKSLRNTYNDDIDRYRSDKSKR
jgi:hypothetical protein